MRNPVDFLGNTLLAIPWWANLLLAGITFVLMYYALPIIDFGNPVANYTVELFSRVLSYVFSAILLLFSIISALKN